ncbi:MAG: DUF4922 domain-containing protein [Candidatus Margulisiibacteriota bacterium]|jgi:hypothetical protein
MKKIISFKLKASNNDNLISKLSGLKWDDFQKELAKIYHQTKDLNLVLDLLWQTQLAAGFISKDVFAYVNNITKIESPNEKIKFVIECNPARLNRGTSASKIVNPVNILPGKNIPCFCCLENIKAGWPIERGFEITLNKKQYVFLPNPAPLFSKHFTLAAKTHQAQIMDISAVLAASAKIKNLWVAQNGANAGASNPWHLHLQIADVEFPITNIPALISKNTKFVDSYLISEKLDYLFSVYRFKFDYASPKVVNYLTKLQNYYLSLDPNNRLTYVVKNSGNGFELYITLRSALKEKVASYSENVGYPEPLGFLATPYEKEKNDWVCDGLPRYKKVLEELSIDQNYIRKFESFMGLNQSV